MTRFKVLVIRVATALAVLGAAVGLGACGHDMQQTKRDVFLSVVHDKYPQTNTPAWNKALVQNAHAVCGALRRGASADQIVNLVVSQSATANQAREFGYIIGAGVKVYCPKYSHIFN